MNKKVKTMDELTKKFDEFIDKKEVNDSAKEDFDKVIDKLVKPKHNLEEPQK